MCVVGAHARGTGRRGGVGACAVGLTQRLSQGRRFNSEGTHSQNTEGAVTCPQVRRFRKLMSLQALRKEGREELPRGPNRGPRAMMWTHRTPLRHVTVTSWG